MAEQLSSKEVDSKRLRAIEAQNGVVQKCKEAWRDSKEVLAQDRKAYEEAVDTLSELITPPDEPLLNGEAGETLPP